MYCFLNVMIVMLNLVHCKSSATASQALSFCWDSYLLQHEVHFPLIHLSKQQKKIAQKYLQSSVDSSVFQSILGNGFTFSLLRFCLLVWVWGLCESFGNFWILEINSRDSWLIAPMVISRQMEQKACQSFWHSFSYTCPLHKGLLYFLLHLESLYSKTNHDGKIKYMGYLYPL